MCSNDQPSSVADESRHLTDPASASGVAAFNELLRKLKPAIALAAGRKAAQAYQRKWYLRNIRRKHVYALYRRALARGDLVRPEKCEQCGGDTGGIQGHHCDYDKPLEVMWLCRWCHTKWHRDNGKALNSD